MKIRMHIITAAFALVLVSCSTAAQTTEPKAARANLDNSIASTLYETGLKFEAERKKGRSLGMANAARDRAIIVETLRLKGDNRTSTYAISASIRDMLDEARRAANGDKETLLSIDRLFPNSMPAQSNSNQNLRRLFGTPRKVQVTIGLEMDVRLSGGTIESKIIPVNSALPTTVFVRPALGALGKDLDIALKVSPVAVDGNTISEACQIKDKIHECACVVQPGDFSEIEISIANKSESNIALLVFVSGNATTLATAFTPE